MAARKKTRRNTQQKTNKTSLKSKPSFQKPLLYGLLTALAIGFIGYGAYSVYLFQNSEQEEEGFVVCNPENTKCEVSQHIHSDIELNVCGQDIKFGKEKGNTQFQHTHKEQNKLHWHNRVSVDPITKEPLDSSHTAIRGFLEQMDYQFPAACETNPSPQVTVEINGKVQEQGLDASWKDGDIIEVSFN